MVPEQEEFASINLSPLARSWETLKGILSHDSARNGWKYHVEAISIILLKMPNVKLPQWLVQSLEVCFKRDFLLNFKV